MRCCGEKINSHFSCWLLEDQFNPSNTGTQDKFPCSLPKDQFNQPYCTDTVQYVLSEGRAQLVFNHVKFGNGVTVLYDIREEIILKQKNLICHILCLTFFCLLMIDPTGANGESILNTPNSVGCRMHQKRKALQLLREEENENQKLK